MSDRPDELRRQLSTLWRAARTGIDTMREIAVRSSEVGRLRLDIVLLQRERNQLLVEMGQLVCRFLDADDADEDRPIPPELRRLHRRIREVESRLRASSIRAHDNAFGAPRGYEPEAAVDYGDEAAVEDASEDVAPATRRRAPRKRVTSSRKKSSKE